MSLESSVLLYNKGSLKINEQKNELLLEQQKKITEQIKNNISLQLIGNYLTVLLDKELLIVNKNSLNTYKEDLERNEKLYNAGAIALSVVYEAKANYANAKQSFENSKIDLDRALMNLAMLLQKDYKDFAIEDMEVVEDLNIPLDEVNDIISYSYKNQPEIKSVELSIEASEKDIELAKAALYPTVTGNYTAGTQYIKSFNNSATDALFNQWDNNFNQTLSLGISIPIFNKGISKEKIETTKIQKSINENELEQEKLALKQTIQSSHFDVVSSHLTYISAKESVNSTELSYEFAQKSFNAGRINLYDLNITRNNYFNAQSQMLQAKYNYLFKLKILDFYAGKSLEISSDDKIYTKLNSKISTQPVDNSNGLDTPPTVDKKIQSSIEKKPVDDTLIKETETIIDEKVEKPVDTVSTISKEEENTIVKDVETFKEEAPEEAILTVEDKKDTTVIVKDTKTSTEEKIEKPVETKNNKDKQKVKDKEEKTITSEEAKRQKMIETHRKKLQEGMSNKPMDDKEREALIKERREKLQRGIVN